MKRRNFLASLFAAPLFSVAKPVLIAPPMPNKLVPVQAVTLEMARVFNLHRHEEYQGPKIGDAIRVRKPVRFCA